MTEQELIDLIAAGERPGVEFKNARARTDINVDDVIKCALAMANRRNGGLIVIGVNDDMTTTGLTAVQATTWARPDDVRKTIDHHADPFVYVDSELVTITAAGPFANQTFCILTVAEFEDVPVLCGRPITRGTVEVLR